MTFTGIFLGRTGHWVACWRTPMGNVIHDRLPRTVGTREHAEAYALGNPPSW